MKVVVIIFVKGLMNKLGRHLAVFLDKRCNVRSHMDLELVFHL